MSNSVEAIIGVILIAVIVIVMTAMILWCRWIIEKIAGLDDKTARGIVRSIHHER
ncbi:MAG: hypothetical protein PF692_05800 [Kiritimatiellae bacterium]|jgi:flagellar basal body-associated protein FliL|nr:hypothetical protein [Kiritimatiellia bacterium]